VPDFSCAEWFPSLKTTGALSMLSFAPSSEVSLNVYSPTTVVTIVPS
jgi:hypothetical protein